MTEYIKREAVYEDFEKCNSENPKWTPSRVKTLIARQKAADVAPEQKWIPVTERLPEEEGLYLVAVVNDHERRYSKTAWYHGHGNWFLHQKVTHWMLLPEPPKEE